MAGIGMMVRQWKEQKHYQAKHNNGSGLALESSWSL